MSTREWLTQIGLEQYIDAFDNNDIDLDVLPELDETDLEKIGVGSLGHRKKLLKAIASLDLDDTVSAETSNTGDASKAQSAPNKTTVSESERRHLTVMFCDLVGSTALASEYDPEEFSEILRAYQDACAGIVSRYDGYIAQYLGDGIMVYFGFPHAHEDDAERAIRTGREIIASVSKLKPRPEVELSTRIGIATGVVLVGDGEVSGKDQLVLGETPNLAARLQAMAKPNQLLVADETRRLSGELFEFSTLEAQALKGFRDPVVAHIVQSTRSTESRFDARSSRVLPIVGRDQEINLLTERWRMAKSGEGQLVVLSGEAGIGKSRITRALIDEVKQETHFRISYQCSPYHSDSTLYPVIHQLQMAGRFDAEADEDARFETLESVLTMPGEQSNEHMALMTGLAGLNGEARYGELELSPQQRRARTLKALKDQLIGFSHERPTLVLLEDAHWIDPTTQEHIESLLEDIESQRVLIVITARPGYAAGFAGHPIVTWLTLNRLGRSHISSMVNRLTQGLPFPDELLDEIASKTDGVPLFVEELTKTILETGLVRQSGTRYELVQPVSDLAIPLSLHDSLMARLDRLQPVKEVAQIAACIGREFDRALLVAASRLNDRELDMALERLSEAELIYRRGDGSTYQFKHALVRDAAYQSLLKSKRIDIHGLLVTAIETTGTYEPELLAYHATKAKQKQKAIDYWEQAGELAISRPAYREAIGHLSNAIELCGELGSDPKWKERELKLQIALGQAMIATYGYGAQPTVDTFQRALALVEILGDTPLRMPALFGEWVASYVRGTPFAEQVERFVRLADETSNLGAQMVAQRLLALASLHKGNFSDALNLIEKALELYESDDHRRLARDFGHDQRTAALNYKCWALWHLGYPEKALEVGRESANWARELNHANTIGLGTCWGVLVANVLQRDTNTVINESSELIRYAEEMAMPLWVAWSRVFMGWARVVGNDDAAGINDIREGLAGAEHIGAALLMPLLLCLAAESALSTGDIEQARRYIRAAFEAMETSGDSAWAAQLYLIEGQILLHGDQPQAAAAEEMYLRAIKIAREQNSKMLELRAATVLAELWNEANKVEDAKALIRPLYEGFTEGWDTPDLQKAHSVLESL
ncbi:MAG: AAA family ATPase [Pseudomonadota bacterium]